MIPNYNYARFVGEAIESVLAQDPPFDDVVVVDDGSTDGSLDVINRYKPQVRVISKQNAGSISACITGARSVATDYVYFLDSDDYIVPDFLSCIRPQLAAEPAKVQFQLMGVDADRTILGGQFPNYLDSYDSKTMLHDNRVLGFYLCPPTSGNVFRTKTLIGLDLDSLDSRESIDGPPAMAMPYLGPVRSINKPLAYYRVHGRGQSRWDQADASLLQYEIEWFGRRWADVCRLLGLKEPPFGNHRPLYVLERELMIASLEGHLNIALKSGRFIRRLLTAHLPKKQKLMLAVWALSLILPLPKWRKQMVLARRSPLNRPSGLSRLVRRMVQPRKPAVNEA